jgi:hypothetical protein
VSRSTAALVSPEVIPGAVAVYAGQDAWERARERERVIKGLMEGEGDLEARIVAGSETLGVSLPRPITSPQLVVRSRNHKNGGNNDPKAVKAVEQSERDWLVQKEDHHHQFRDTGNAKDAAKQPLRHQSPRSRRDRLPPKHPTKFNRSEQGSGTCAEDRRRHGEALKSLADRTSPQDE